MSAGFFYPSVGSPTDTVELLAVIDDGRDDGNFQNVGYSEDYKVIVYGHPVAGSYGFLTTFKIQMKIGMNWGTNQKFSDLRDFIRQTINYAEKKFYFLDVENNEYAVRFKEGSFKYRLIPGTKIYLVTLELWLATD